MLVLRVLNSDAEVNNFQYIGSSEFYSGEDFKVVLQIINANSNLRRMMPSTASFSIDLLNSDGSTLTKTPTLSFTGDPGDQSIVEFSVTAAESVNLISQDLKLTITEGSETKIAFLRQGLTKVLSGGC